jgi:hypothetical protein
MLGVTHGGPIMSRAQDINDFVKRREPAAFCDDCIAKKLELPRRQQSAAITETLGTTTDFTREHGLCSVCASEKKVIHARGL